MNPNFKARTIPNATMATIDHALAEADRIVDRSQRNQVARVGQSPAVAPSPALSAPAAPVMSAGQTVAEIDRLFARFDSPRTRADATIEPEPAAKLADPIAAARALYDKLDQRAARTAEAEAMALKLKTERRAARAAPAAPPQAASTAVSAKTAEGSAAARPYRQLYRGPLESRDHTLARLGFSRASFYYVEVDGRGEVIKAHELDEAGKFVCDRLNDNTTTAAMTRRAGAA